MRLLACILATSAIRAIARPTAARAIAAESCPLWPSSLLALTRWSARRGLRSGGFGAVDHHHLVASREVLLEVEEVIGVEGRAVEFAGVPVLLLHHEAG